jgi:UDP-2-acetamido-3-amino-2,3-dideoxy-glucuronate N-acetyltransferase
MDQKHGPFFFIHPSSCADDGAVIGSGTNIWHFSHISGTAIIGENCILGQNVYVGHSVAVGNGVKIQNNVSLYQGVILEDDVFIGPSAVFTNVLNPRSFIERKSEFLPTKVRKGASIGANATLVCGIEVGEYALVGAGSVVVRDVPAYALVLGNPARQLGWVSRQGNRLEFDDQGLATCNGDGSRYALVSGQVSSVFQPE